jgi:uncharacterized membrane protein
VSKNIINRVAILSRIKTLKIGSSYLICINTFITSADLNAAIARATKSVQLPRLIPAIVTVIDVNAMRLIQINRYVPYPITC